MQKKKTGKVLFTWDLRERARRRRWFYFQLKRFFRELRPGSWRKLGGSVYLVEENCSQDLEKLLRHYEGPDLKWHKMKIKKYPTSQL